MSWDAEYVWATGDEPPKPAEVRRAGDRIRKAVERGVEPREEDIHLLDIYRAWHRPVLNALQTRLGVAVSAAGGVLGDSEITIGGRPLKTPEAIIAKLVREKSRLSRIQDIAGARIVVPDLEVQKAVIQLVLNEFADAGATVVKDTRGEGDALGYRGVHVVVLVEGRYAEIQIRTTLQGLWAQVVEKIDETQGSDLKHGSGPEATLEWLQEFSRRLRRVEYGDKVDLGAFIEAAMVMFLMGRTDNAE